MMKKKCNVSKLKEFKKNMDQKIESMMEDEVEYKEFMARIREK